MAAFRPKRRFSVESLQRNWLLLSRDCGSGAAVVVDPKAEALEGKAEVRDRRPQVR
jgi:hypothetical protein